MLTHAQIEEARQRAAHMLQQAGIAIRAEERQDIEVAGFGLDALEHPGLEIVVYTNTERYCAKELVLFPRQTCPDHRHPSVAGGPGKMETFRCRWGRVWLYVPGQPSASPHGQPPAGSEPYYSVFHEITLDPGDQYTIPPDTLHWFQAGGQGAIVSEFSSTSRDESDVFSDPRIRRLPQAGEA